MLGLDSITFSLGQSVLLPGALEVFDDREPVVHSGSFLLTAFDCIISVEHALLLLCIVL